MTKTKNDKNIQQQKFIIPFPQLSTCSVSVVRVKTEEKELNVVKSVQSAHDAADERQAREQLTRAQKRKGPNMFGRMTNAFQGIADAAKGKKKDKTGKKAGEKVAIAGAKKSDDDSVGSRPGRSPPINQASTEEEIYGGAYSIGSMGSGSIYGGSIYAQGGEMAMRDGGGKGGGAAAGGGKRKPMPRPKMPQPNAQTSPVLTPKPSDSDAYSLGSLDASIYTLGDNNYTESEIY